MSKTTFIGLVIFILVLPIIYLVLNATTGMDAATNLFRGQPVTMVQPPDGEVIMPTVQEDQAGAVLHATYSPGLLEKLAGSPPPGNKPLELTIDNLTDEGECLADGTPPPRSRFEIQARCYNDLFKSPKKPEGTALFVDEPLGLVSLISSDKNAHRMLYHGWVATYETGPMTQSEIRKQGCVARAMLNHLFSITDPQPASCTGG